MSSEAVRAIFRQIVPAAAAPTPYIETVDTQVDLGKCPDAWVTLEFVQSQRQRVSIGSPGCFRETGQVDVHCITRSGTGDAAATALAEQITQALLQTRIAHFRFVTIDSPTLSPSDSGNWADLVVPCEYAFDSIAAT